MDKIFKVEGKVVASNDRGDKIEIETELRIIDLKAGKKAKNGTKTSS